MKILKPWVIATIVAFAALFVTTTHSFADTYRIYNLGSDEGYFFYGMDDFGNVAIVDHDAGPVCDYLDCYYSYFNGVSTGAPTITAPVLVDDQGTPCTPALPAGGSVIKGVCNNGREAFTGRLTPGQVFPNVYTGPDLSALLPYGGESSIYMNSLGDIVFDDVFTEEWFEAIDLTTAPVPEPNSLCLLATGVLAASAAIRRRLK